MTYERKSDVHKEFIYFKRHLSKMRKECREKHQKMKSKNWKDKYDQYNFAYQVLQDYMNHREI